MKDHGIYARGMLQKALKFSLDYPSRHRPDARYFEYTPSVSVREEVQNLWHL
jgi:hypothetical protein